MDSAVQERSGPGDDAPVVDTHFHVFTTDMPLLASAWHKPAEDASVEQALATLDRHGVAFGVIAPASMHGDYNDYIRSALIRHKRLRATAIVRPDISRYELERMKDDGFVGIRLAWKMMESPPDIDSDSYRILLRRVADLGWHVHIMERGDRLADVIDAVERAGARVVIDHMSLPEPRLGLNDPGFKAVLAAADRGRTWIKLSAGYRFDPPAAATQFATELLRVAGPDRLVWGSDWPFVGFESKVSYAETIDSLRRWVPDPAIRRRIVSETPLKLYFT